MKIFAVSDIHSFFEEFYLTLKTKGFEENNPNHLLVCCGDYFDRGPDPQKVMNYLMGLENVVLIRGNHEDCFDELVDREEPWPHDIHNGTWETVCQFNGIGQWEVTSIPIEKLCQTAMLKTRHFFDKMVNYYETKNYVFVHATTPKITDWRNGNEAQWKKARWENPFKYYKNSGIDKTVVFGHWHCSTGWARSEGREEFGEEACFEPFYGDGYIGIDACTAYSGMVNVIVIEDEKLEN